MILRCKYPQGENSLNLSRWTPKFCNRRFFKPPFVGDDKQWFLDPMIFSLGYLVSLSLILVVSPALDLLIASEAGSAFGNKRFIQTNFGFFNRYSSMEEDEVILDMEQPYDHHHLSSL